jgi:hypothetical protein
MSFKLKSGAVALFTAVGATLSFGCTTVAPSPMAQEQCERARFCTVQGVASAKRVERVWMAEVALNDGKCVRVSLPEVEIARLRGDGPKPMTLSGRVYGDPPRTDEVVTFEVNGRKIGLGTCGDFFVFIAG